MTKEEILERLHQINESIKIMDSYNAIYIEGCVRFRGDYDLFSMINKSVLINRKIVKAALLVEKECLEAEYNERFVCRACGKNVDVITVDEPSLYVVKE